MPFLELSIHCRESEQPRYENALDDVGALAVTLLDADAATPNERAILEPGVGETPLWGEVALSALFPHDADALMLLAAACPNSRASTDSIRRPANTASFPLFPLETCHETCPSQSRIVGRCRLRHRLHPLGAGSRRPLVDALGGAAPINPRKP